MSPICTHSALGAASCGCTHPSITLVAVGAQVVGCIVEHEGKILLCKRAIEPCKGKWTLPAGYMELKESSAGQPCPCPFRSCPFRQFPLSPFTHAPLFLPPANGHSQPWTSCGCTVTKHSISHQSMVMLVSCFGDLILLLLFMPLLCFLFC